MEGMADGAIIIDTKIDTEGLAEALKQLDQTVKKFVDTFGKQFDSMDKSVEKSTRKIGSAKIAPTTEGIDEAVRSLDILNAKIETEQHLLDELHVRYGRTVSIMSETSDEALQLQKKILKAEDSIAKMTRTSDSMASAIGTAEEAMKDGAKSADNLGDKGKKADEGLREGGKGAGAFEMALGSLIARGVEKAISALADLSEKTLDYRRDMAMMAQNAKDSGMSLAFMNDAAKYLNGTTGDLDGSLEAVNSLLSTGLNENQMVKAVEALSGAIVRFPGTYKIDSLTASFQETIKSGKATEQFAELLGRSGQDIGEFNKKMANARTESQKTNIAVTALAKTGLAEASEEYRTINKSMVDAADAQYEYKEALAVLGEVMQPISTEIMREFTKMLADNKDEISQIIRFVGEFAKVLVQLLGKIVGVNPVLLFLGTAIGVIALSIAKFAATTWIMTSAVAGGTKALSSAGPAAINAGVSFALLALEITAVATAIAFVVGSIAALISAIKGVPAIMINSTFENPSKKIRAALDGVQERTITGYAHGTLSAAPGLHWVGERGPELREFKGGEAVYNTTQSLAMRTIAGSAPAYQPNIFNVTIDAKNVKEFNDIVRIAQNRRQSIRKGYVGR